jgi:hypothetical protein
MANVILQTAAHHYHLRAKLVQLLVETPNWSAAHLQPGMSLGGIISTEVQKQSTSTKAA